MARNKCTDVIVYMCHNCLPDSEALPRQWKQGEAHVEVRLLPCTGKINTRYIFHALEGGCLGVCIIACPPGECSLSQGNYRSRMRINTTRRLLEEIGLEPGRAEYMHFSKDDDPEELKKLINDCVDRMTALGKNPVAEMKETLLAN